MPKGEEVSFEDFLVRVQRVRKLRAQEPVLGLRVEEDELIDHVERSFKKELPPHALHATETMLVLLGTVPFGFDFERAMLGLLRSQLAGLYDPRKNAMFVRADLSGEELEATLLHELVHALQDQTYDLDEFSSYREDGTDRASALSALAEGDATSAMYDGMLALVAERESIPVRTALDLPTAQLTAGMDAAAEVPEEGDVPRIVRRSLIAPYRDGVLFVHELRRTGGWEAVDRAWKQPPTSTEQLLHPERYLDREPPIATSVIAGPDPSWKKILTDVWGEQSLRLVFEEVEGSRQAAARATGWGGDRIAVFGKGSERAVTWHLIADDQQAAEGFFQGFQLLADGTAGEGATDEAGSSGAGSSGAGSARAESSPTVSSEAPSHCVLRPKTGPLSVSRKGKHVLVVAGPYHPSEGADASATCKASQAWMRRALGAL